MTYRCVPQHALLALSVWGESDVVSSDDRVAAKLPVGDVHPRAFVSAHGHGCVCVCVCVGGGGGGGGGGVIQHSSYNCRTNSSILRAYREHNYWNQ